MSRTSFYAVYDEEDFPLCVGNAVECAGYLGIELSTLYQTVSKFKSGVIDPKIKIYVLEDEKDAKKQRRKKKISRR